MTRLRFYLAILISKCLLWGISLIAPGRGTNLPGAVALRLDPAFLSHLQGIPKDNTVFVTGTNGKSTCVKLLYHILTQAGYRVVTNLDGANMTSGVAVPLLKACSLLGNVSCDYLLLEVDERYLSVIEKQLPCKYLCVTNIQKDQVQRNGEPDFIRKKIASAIKADMVLFLNADEPNAASLATRGTVRYYSVKGQTVKRDFFSLSMPCPLCHRPIAFKTQVLANMGQFACACGLGCHTPASYVTEDYSFQKQSFTLNGQTYPIYYPNHQFLYSYTLAVSVALELGIHGIAAALDCYIGKNDRVTQRSLGRHSLLYYKMKQENSETLQGVLNTVARDRTDKVILFGNDEYIDFYPPYVNTCYLFDCDFSALRDSGVVHWFSASTAMGHTAALRFLYDGVSPEQITVLPDSLASTLHTALTRTHCENAYLIEEIPYWKR